MQFLCPNISVAYRLLQGEYHPYEAIPLCLLHARYSTMNPSHEPSGLFFTTI
jgi:hypothetical protein